jgi:hypothetical protein
VLAEHLARDVGKAHAVIDANMLLHLFKLLAHQDTFHEEKAARVEVAQWQQNFFLGATLLIKH